jgi:hypothetical protein
LDHVLSIIGEKHQQLVSVIAGNDRRYEERFAASQKALELGLAAQKSEIGAALVAADRAVQKAETAAEKRFEGVNEFRNTLADQQRTLIPRSEVEALMKNIENKIDQVEKVLDRMSVERQGIKGGYGYAVGIVGFVLTVVSIGVLVMKGLGN